MSKSSRSSKGSKGSKGTGSGDGCDYHILEDDASPECLSFAKQTAAVLELTPIITSSSVNAFPSTTTTTTTTTTNPYNATSSSASPTIYGPTAPLVRASAHLLKPNGSISGREVANTILPMFKDLLSAIPSNSHRNAVSSIDGRASISHSRIHQFLIESGRVLHERVRIGRGHRIAVVLPNGPELALAILVVTCWASCVPLNAFAASAELQSDLEKCGAHCIIGMDPTRTQSGGDIQQLAAQLHIPFCGLVPDPDNAGLFELVPPVQLPRSIEIIDNNSNRNFSNNSVCSKNSHGTKSSKKSHHSRTSRTSQVSKDSKNQHKNINTTVITTIANNDNVKAIDDTYHDIDDCNNDKEQKDNIESKSLLSTGSNAEQSKDKDTSAEQLEEETKSSKEEVAGTIQEEGILTTTAEQPEESNKEEVDIVVQAVTRNASYEEDISLLKSVVTHDDDDIMVNNDPMELPSCFENREIRQMPNQHDDEVLVLFTSGTTGIKKLVPHLLADVLVATATISVSWKLTPLDTNCNLMPLFHVGGIIRQVFSPVLSGGCVICCPSFDPLTFWHLMNNGGKNESTNMKKPSFTWYYAAPTMHQLILQTGRAEGYLPDINSRDENGNPINRNMNSPASSSQTKPALRMIANAAGGLLPSLARELRQAFGANVLPSYGMTECMPITSPPANYQLEKPGTSGVAVGPELAILNTDTLEPLQTGKEGPICVRHEPCFRGYGIIANKNNNNDTEEEKPVTFLKTPEGECSGWFDTGDLGYMDSDGFLYITGRSKEVINRGGEIISPMEVEEAIIAHPDVEACAAFSTAHSVLQEVVGLVLVSREGRPRLDLPTLHEYLGEGRLAAPKWPQCLVYMDGGLPKSFTNKLLRVKLGKRLCLPELNDHMYPIERTFQASCPPIGTDIAVSIPCERVSVNASQVQYTLQQELLIDRERQELIVVRHQTKIGALVAYVYNIDRFQVIQIARAKVDGYSVPTHVCLLSGPLDSINRSNLELLDEFLPPPQPSDAVVSIMQEEISKGAGPADPLVTEVQELMQMMLNLDCLPAPITSFFNLGGSSMLASQLASKVRKLYNIPFGGAEVFHHSTCNAIATVIRERQGDMNGSQNGGQISVSGSAANGSMGASSLYSKKLDLSKTPFEHSRMEIQPGYFTILFQLMPLCLIYPFWALSRMFIFFLCLINVLNRTPEIGHAILKFILTLIAFHFAWIIFTPLVFVLCKWVIIGRYRHGRYPIWGSYYLRWWLVDILRKIIGRGAWGGHDFSLNMFYRLLGAKIGKGVRISAQAELAEFDMISIGDGAAIELSTVRGFGIDNGAMILGPVRVGDNASVGIRCVVPPYTSIPDNAHLGPISTSYEISAVTETGNDAKHVQYNRQALPQPSAFSQTFVVGFIVFIVNSFARIPALTVLYYMLTQPWNYDRPFQSTGHMLQWLCDPRRIPFFVGIRIARSLLAPFFHMSIALLVKWCIIGKFKPGPRNTKSEWQLIRHALAAQLFSRESIQDVTNIIGRHYYLVSALYRLMGAKVGKRVFWPGRQPIFTGEFDLLEIGDDVVFGSRTAIFFTTMDSAEKIILCAGSNVSDNTVVLPGSILGKGSVLGSNTICPAGRYLPEASVWLGSRGGVPVLLEKGTEVYDGPLFACDIKPERLQMEGDESTIRPFGKAFYHGESTYFVYPLSLIILFTIANRVLVACLNSLPIIGALHLAAGFYYGWPISDRNYMYVDMPLEALYPVLLSFFIITHFMHTVIWLLVEVSAKWGFMGERHEGRYNYDTSNYGQNWELYQITTKVRDLGRVNFLDLISGTPFIASYFRMLGCKIGNDCCLYPAGGDPYMPEPDLVEMGDRVVIDCASVVCHLNTRGNFELAKIVMESNVTLRTRARIQQAVYMESGSMLLEKSLAMTGEIIEADSVWYGGPAARLLNYENSSISTRPSAAASFSGSQDAGAYV